MFLVYTRSLICQMTTIQKDLQDNYKNKCYDNIGNGSLWLAIQPPKNFVLTNNIN